MSSRTLRNRVIGFIELADPAAPSDTWDQLVGSSSRTLASASRPPRDATWSGPSGRARDKGPRILANVVQLRLELEVEFAQLCHDHPELPVTHRAD